MMNKRLTNRSDEAQKLLNMPLFIPTVLESNVKKYASVHTWIQNSGSRYD